MYGIDGRRDLTESTRRPPQRVRGARPVRIGNGAFDQRQNDVFGAALDAILLHSRRSQRLPAAALADRAGAGGVRDEGVARARPGHLGGARRPAALRVVQADVLGRARPGRRLAEIRGDADLEATWAGHRRGDPGRHPRARRQRARGPPPALRHRRARRLHLLVPLFGFLPADDERTQGQRAGHRRRAHRERLRAPLPHRRDRRRAVRQGGHVPHLLVLARVRAVRSSASTQRASDLFERLLRVASPLGLYAEEFDVETGYHLGNFPQAFSHLALIEAAGRLILNERVRELQ